MKNIIEKDKSNQISDYEISKVIQLLKKEVDKIKTIPQLKIILGVGKINKLFEGNLAILS